MRVRRSSSLYLDSADKLLADRAVCAASSNAIGWSVGESLAGASWRNYCTDGKHALVVKDAITVQEKRATDPYEHDRKDRERKDRGSRRRDHDYGGYKSRRSYRAGPQEGYRFVMRLARGTLIMGNTPHRCQVRRLDLLLQVVLQVTLQQTDACSVLVYAICIVLSVMILLYNDHNNAENSRLKQSTKKRLLTI